MTDSGLARLPAPVAVLVTDEWFPLAVAFSRALIGSAVTPVLRTRDVGCCVLILEKGRFVKKRGQRLRRQVRQAGSRPGRLRNWLRKCGVVVRRDGLRLYG